MNDSDKHTLVVGGGIIGACCAWYLHKAGRRVTLIDRSDVGAGCSHGNCGYVSPSHILPLTAPGKIADGIKGMIFRNRALRIRPQLSPSLWWWLLKFASRCNRNDMLQAGRARHALLQSSRTLYQQLIESEQLQAEWKTDGLFFVFRDQRAFDRFAETDRLLQEEFGVAAERLDGAQLCETEPALKPGLAGAWWYHDDAHLRPDRLMTELKRLLTESGVRIVPECELLRFQSSDGKVNTALTSQGELVADEFVVAAGPLTPLLNRHLGCRIPIQPGKGYSITMPRPKICPRYPLILEDVHVAITPFDSGYRIGSTMEFTGYDATLNRQRLNYLRRGAAEFLVEPEADPVEEEWCGWRPMTWDGVPYIDRTPKFSNVWVAAGHNMLGLSMGTATGKLISELITGQKPHLDPTPYRIGRQ